MLELHDIRVRHGGVLAVKGIDLHVEKNEIVALVGANGAGKTSTLEAIAGILPADGRISFLGRDIGHLKPHRRVQQGVVMVPEGRGILAGMSVRENLLLGGYTRRREADLRARVAAVLERFPQLQDRAHMPAGNLSGGEQQLLAIGRALIAAPQLLALDEPSLGLAPRLLHDVLRTVQQLRQEGMTVLLVEQNVRQALQVADRAYVLQTGQVTLDGPAAELLNAPEINDAFLGGAAHGQQEEGREPSRSVGETDSD